jgi:hypothetical protein
MVIAVPGKPYYNLHVMFDRPKKRPLEKKEYFQENFSVGS